MSQFNLLFYPKNQKTTKDGRTPIYLKISDRFHLPTEISSGISLSPGQSWDVKLKRIAGEDLAIEDLNDELSVIRKKIKEIIKIHAKIHTTPHEIKNIYIKQEGKQDTSIVITLVDVYKKFLSDEIIPKVGIKLSPGTLEHYERNLNRLQSFLAYIKKPNILPINFTAELASEMKKYLMNPEYQYNNKIINENTAKAVIQFVRRSLDYAVVLSIIPFNPLQSLDLSIHKNINRVHLELSELEKWEKYKTTKRNRLKAKILFLIQSYTGLSYIDTQIFVKEKHISIIEGVKCINMLRHKNRFRKNQPDTFVPLQPKALELLEAINYEIPKIHKVTYWYNLRKISQELGINKKISSHKGRKTFGDHLINELGIGIEDVTGQLGHSSTAITYLYYARPNQKRIINIMKNKAGVRPAA